MCSGPKDPPPLEKTDASQDIARYLYGNSGSNYQGIADPALQNRIIGSENEFRPQYTALNLQDIQQTVEGVDGQSGLLDIITNASQQMEETRAATASSQRESDISDVEALGSRATDAFRASDPYAQELIDEQRALSQGTYARAQGVTAQQQRQAEQQARQASGARGRLNDNSSIAAEILGREEFQRMNRAEATQMGGQTLNMYQQTASDPFQAILGRPARMQGQQISQQGQNLLGSSTNQLFNTDAGVNLAMQDRTNEANRQNDIYGAQAAPSGSMGGGLLGGIGSILGGLF